MLCFLLQKSKQIFQTKLSNECFICTKRFQSNQVSLVSSSSITVRRSLTINSCLSALMPKAARCDFNNDSDFCGWSDPMLQIESFWAPSKSWTRKNGRTKLQGINGDLSAGEKGNNSKAPLFIIHSFF